MDQKTCLCSNAAIQTTYLRIQTNILQLMQQILASTNPRDRFHSHRSVPPFQHRSTRQHLHRSTGHIQYRPIDALSLDYELMISMEPENLDGNRRMSMKSTEMSLDMHEELAPEIYTKDENNELATGICGAQEKLGEELQTVVDDTYQPLDRGYSELYRSMAEMRIEIDSMKKKFEQKSTPSTSIDANKATSIDVQPPTSNNPSQAENSVKKEDEWEIAYINTKINDIYSTLNNNIAYTTSIDSKFASVEDRLQSYEDMHDRFTSPIMRYLDSLSKQMTKVQMDVGTIQDQLGS
ncbi:hypothetical protein Bca101_057475 [Brassica carinata]